MRGGIVSSKELLAQDENPAPRILCWDMRKVIAAPASGTVSSLLGSTDIPPVPRGYRGIIDGIGTYLEGGAGPITQFRIPGTGVTITWQLLIDGQPFWPWNAITNILPTGFTTTTVESPLAEISEKSQLTATVTNVDPNGLYAFLGIRVSVKFIPWQLVRPIRPFTLNPSLAMRSK